MSNSERTCLHCGAHIARVEAKFCEFCGTELPRPARQANVVLPPERTEMRFRALQDQEDLEELLRHEPSTTGQSAKLGCGLAFPVVFVVVAIVMVTLFAQASAPRAMILVPVLFVVFGIIMFVSMVAKSAAFANAPLEARPVLVVDERVAVSGGGKNSSASTTYYAMLESEDGRRHEYTILPKIASLVAPNDMGIAYLKGDYLIDFKRIRV